MLTIHVHYLSQLLWSIKLSNISRLYIQSVWSFHDLFFVKGTPHFLYFISWNIGNAEYLLYALWVVFHLKDGHVSYIEYTCSKILETPDTPVREYSRSAKLYTEKFLYQDHLQDYPKTVLKTTLWLSQKRLFYQEHWRWQKKGIYLDLINNWNLLILRTVATPLHFAYLHLLYLFT